ncbi:MAG TPA: hypothetical protein VN228_04785, partial [Pyrinomonadaceae bacterium]|nr:hypothetical protein [Pyrinomonadaceae bacterium]
MLTFGLLILSMLSVGAVWFALSRLRASEGRREQAERELSALRGRLEDERRRAALKPPGAARADDGRETGREPAAGDATDEPPPHAADDFLAAPDAPAAGAHAG